MIQEKRRHPRMRKKIILEIRKKRLVFFRGPETVGQIVNISKSGMMLITKMPLEIQDGLEISIKSKDFLCVKPILGKVVWIEKDYQNKIRFYKAGIEFQKLNSEHKDILEKVSYERS